MGKPAARALDPTTPPHTATLAPSPGDLTVVVGGQPAWRCNVDTAVCATPIAPPAPAPHGPEVCYLGSLSVMYGSQMAVRITDQLMGAGGPNPVMKGEPTVLIGDMGFGLANPANMDEFCKDMADIVRNWAAMTPKQRRRALQNAINKQLSKSGLPTQAVRGSAAHAPGNAQYVFNKGVLEVSQQQLDAASLTSQEAKQLANAVYHEGRHAEQWFLMARQEAAQGVNAGQIGSSMGVPQTFANAAEANPLGAAASAEQNLASSCQQSVYGPNSPAFQYSNNVYRNNVLSPASMNTQEGYDKYRALVEEQDAWATGDGLPCG